MNPILLVHKMLPEFINTSTVSLVRTAFLPLSLDLWIHQCYNWYWESIFIFSTHCLCKAISHFHLIISASWAAVWRFQYIRGRCISGSLKSWSPQSNGLQFYKASSSKALCPVSLATPVYHLFCLSIGQCHIPIEWHVHLIKPIFWLRNKAKPTNYRTISLLGSFSKVFVYKHMIGFITQSIFLYQSGFSQRSFNFTTDVYFSQ